MTGENNTIYQNCLQCSLGFMLSMPEKSVPEFHLLDRTTWKKELISWVNSIGLYFSEGFEPINDS